MEKRSRQRVRDQVALMAFGAESRMRSSARGYPSWPGTETFRSRGRIQKRKTYRFQIITFGLQRAAGPYSCVREMSRKANIGNAARLVGLIACR